MGRRALSSARHRTPGMLFRRLAYNIPESDTYKFIDNCTKAQFLEVCDAMGIPATTALTIFVRRVIRDREIPFILSADAKPTDSDK